MTRPRITAEHERPAVVTGTFFRPSISPEIRATVEYDHDDTDKALLQLDQMVADLRAQIERSRPARGRQQADR